MTAIPLTLHRDRFDAGRVRALRRGDHLLVMDRVSGRWVTVDAPTGQLLPLVASAPHRLPEQVRGPVGELRALLLERGIGVLGSERRFEQLNTVILKLTNACNYACSYCYDYETFERAVVLSRDTAVSALTQALDLAERDLWVILHGGEPMLVWQLVEELVTTGRLLAAERGKRVRFAGQSNLSRLNDDIVEFSLRHGIAWGVSIDGGPDLHDHFRVDHQGRGTYVHFARALERYPSFVRGCGVMSTITAANQGRLSELARHFRDLGMASWDWSLFQPIGRGRDQQATFALDPEVLVTAWGELFDAVEAGEFDGFPVLPVKKYLDNFIAGPGGNMCMRPECGAGRDLLSISSDGSVEACDCIDPTGPLAGLGSVGEGLSAARDSEVAARIRSRDLSGTECAKCIWYGVCGGTCLAHAPALDAVWPEACAVALCAFDRISYSLANSPRLLDYQRSLG
ncbi:SPASM domain-containing protein [Streptomyces pactum]|uniref:SPASM domain-containing protein n=1 Tax=Streptomyces pactum TaxID=68249 RepID=A0ABS0NTE9_9ACTN|nr:radical SAM protein [Streptomyces pactum]MBH5338470.1 SPASM domain-containing protein [Streptomyces pactum]